MIFNDFNWHDSILKNIAIDRSNPGKSDSVILNIDMNDLGNTDFVFEEVYYANLDLKFGIISPENILNAYVCEELDPELVEFYSSWKGRLDGLKLNCYIINLNSTGGVIKIVSKGFKIITSDLL